MKLIKVLYYFVFTLFLALFSFSYFIELFFMPTEKQIQKTISKTPGYELKFGSYTWNDTKMGYVSVGNDTAQRVIMVHGSPGAWGNYSEVLEYAAFYNKFNLIAVDRYGYGISGGDQGEPDLGLNASSIRELCKPSKGGRKPILVGHSMGGPIVIKSAIDYGDELEGVISVAGSFDPDLEFNEFYRGIYKVFPINLFFSRELQASNDELFTHRLELKKMSTEWDRINCKVTIIQGGKDNLVDPGNFEFAKGKLTGKDAILTYIPEEDHFIPFMRPEPMLMAIEQMGK